MRWFLRMPLAVRLTLLPLVAWLIANSVHNVVSPGIWVNRGLDDAVVLAAGVLCLARARGRERWAWGLIGAGVVLWGIGDTYWAFVLTKKEEIPIPSWADAGYLAFIPCVLTGAILLVRERSRGVSSSVVIDSVCAALAVGALTAATLFQTALNGVEGGKLAVLTNLAYPLGDLALLGVIVGAVALQRWRLGATWVLLSLGTVIFWGADALYLITNANGTYTVGGFFDSWWAAATVVYAIAAWQPAPAAAAVERESASLRVILLPLAFASTGLAVLVVAGARSINVLAIALAAGSLIAVFVRLGLTFRENARMLRESRVEALTDPLTGLGNRRGLALDLRRLLENGAAGHVLVLFDLDGFKYYNDNFGHPAGDALLARLGGSLARTVGDRGTAYRMGGDEFCVLSPVRIDNLEAILTATSDALTERGNGFVIRCSFGAVLLPLEATSPEDALRVADQRMYRNKHVGRRSTSRQSTDVLLQALAERHPELGDHSTDVARLADAVAERVGMSHTEREHLLLAAELHDIGKMAVPDGILTKPAALDHDEWNFMRRHTVIGERILAAAPALAPVAAIVRASHERMDGKGYPDGLAAEEIPLASRIIGVCDAFHAMTCDRPYQLARDIQAALHELRRCAGTQFDARIVEVFVDVVLEEQSEALAPALAVA